MYGYHDKRCGIRHTIISFEPFFQREELKGMTNAQIGKKLGISTQTVKAMRYNQDVPFETIRILCHELECQPGDILKAITAEYFPARESDLEE